MNVVALFNVREQAWWWRIVDWEGAELARSDAEYQSIAEALEAGSEHRQRLTARRPPILLRAVLRVRRRPGDAA
jgi:hypothetical protein